MKAHTDARRRRRRRRFNVGRVLALNAPLASAPKRTILWKSSFENIFLATCDQGLTLATFQLNVSTFGGIGGVEGVFLGGLGSD